MELLLQWKGVLDQTLAPLGIWSRIIDAQPATPMTKLERGPDPGVGFDAFDGPIDVEDRDGLGRAHLAHKMHPPLGQGHFARRALCPPGA